MRRSLTVTPENDKKILLTKGLFLRGDEPFDIDYTTLVNIFIELGHKVMTSAWSSGPNQTVTIDKNEIIETFKKHYFDAELKEESVGDQVAEIIFRKLLIEHSNKTTQEQFDQQSQPPALPTHDQTTSSENKNPKYIT